MEPTDILLGLLTALVSASWGTTQVRLARIGRELARKADRTELMALRDEMHRGFTEIRAEMQRGFAEMRAEMRGESTGLREEFRSEIATVRSDLTQIALAVGAGRPRAEEG
jgi:elongation factor P--beta-lysine ligase